MGGADAEQPGPRSRAHPSRREHAAGDKLKIRRREMSLPLQTDTRISGRGPGLAALQPPYDVVEAFAVARCRPPGSDERIAIPARNDVEMEVKDVLPAS